MSDQNYKINSEDNVKFNLSVDFQNILEKATERSIVYILHHYNHFNATWANSQEQTRAQVPPQLRRNGLWLSYINNNREQITERFIGKDADAFIYEKWIDSKYWEPLDFELLLSGVKETVENAIKNLDKYPNLKAVIKQKLDCVLRDVMDSSWIEQFVVDNIDINNALQQAIEEFLNSDSFRAYFTSIVEGLIEDLRGEYFED